MEAARQCSKDKKEWCALMHMSMIECCVAFFLLGFRVIFDCPPPLWWLITWVMPLHDAFMEKCENGATMLISKRRCPVYGVGSKFCMIVHTYSDLTPLPLNGIWRRLWHIAMTQLQKSAYFLFTVSVNCVISMNEDWWLGSGCLTVGACCHQLLNEDTL